MIHYQGDVYGDDDYETPNGASRDEAVGGHVASEAGTSEKQIRANRENAKKSTGPRTEAGKARSSQNARKHGIFVSRIEPVQDGPIGEEPDEFYERVEMLVDSMQPRDPVEIEVATRIAGVLIKLERLDRWSATSIASASVMRPADIEAGARSEFRVQAVAQAATSLHIYMACPNLVDEPDFETMAAFLRFLGPRADIKIEGFWDEENTPSGDEEWRRAYEALKNALWSDHDKAVSWASNKGLELSREHEQVKNLEERIAVNRILNGPLPLQLKYEAQLLNSLRILRKEYAELQKRARA